MSILTIGGEADSMPLAFGAYTVSSTGGRFDSDASRNALVVSGGVAEYSTFYAEVTEVWIHAYLYQESVAAGDVIFIGGDTEAFKIAYESDGRWSVYKYVDSDYELVGTTDDPVLVDAGANIDIHILMDVSGGVAIYKDEVEVLNVGPVDTTGDATYLNNIYFQGLIGGSNELMLSQLIVADEDTRGMKLLTLPVTGAGTTSQWSGSAANIDEADVNEADFISALEVDQVSTFATTDIISPAYDSYAAIAVAVGVLANNPSDSFIDTLQAALRVGGVNYFSDDSTTLGHDGITASSTFVFNTDPSNDSAWTKTKVNALEVGVKSADIP
jgi:hypothetical protein